MAISQEHLDIIKKMYFSTNCGMTEIARTTKISRRHLYRLEKKYNWKQERRELYLRPYNDYCNLLLKGYCKLYNLK